MKHKVLPYIIASVGICLSQSLVAQSQEDSPELNKTIKVYSEYKPQINDAQRLSVSPTAYDTVRLPVELKYTFEAAPVDVVSELRTLRAVSVKGDKLQDLFRGYAAIGGGNYNSFMAEFRFMTERSRKYQNGIEFLHNSSAGKIRFEDDEKYPANYMNNTLSIYTKRFLPKVTLSAGIKPSFNRYLNYGRNVNSSYISEVSYAKKEIRRTMFSNQSYVGVQSTNASLDYLNYAANLEHIITAINPKMLENSINLQAHVKQNISELLLGVDFETEWNGVNFEPNDIEIKKNTTQISLKPFLEKSVENVNFKIGLLAQQTIDANSTFKLYPQARISAQFLKQTVVPYISYQGSYKQYSMLEMLNENPHVSDLTLLQPKNTIADLRLGVQGRAATIIPFHAYIQYNVFNNEHFWENNFVAQQENTFVATYDNGNMFRVHGEIGVQQKLFSALAQLSYNHYSLDKLEYAWHKPGIEAQIDLKYNVQNPVKATNKLVATAQFFAYGSMYALTEDFPDAILSYSAEKMPAIVDFNIHLDYYFNTALIVFCRVNNITATRYQRFHLYPSQRTNFLAGLSYSFGNKK